MTNLKCISGAVFPWNGASHQLYWIFLHHGEILIHLWHQTFWGFEAVLQQIQFSTAGNSFLSGKSRSRWTWRYGSSSYSSEWILNEGYWKFQSSEYSDLALVLNQREHLSGITKTYESCSTQLTRLNSVATIKWKLYHHIGVCTTTWSPLTLYIYEFQY